MSVPNIAAANADGNNTNIKVMSKNFAPFKNSITEIINTQVDYVKDTDVLMPMYNLLGYSGNCSETLRSLYQYCRNEPALDNTGAIVDFPNENTTDSFKLEEEITGHTSNNYTKKRSSNSIIKLSI